MKLAKRIVETVLDDLKGRKGIGNELESVAPTQMGMIKIALERKVQAEIDKKEK